MASVIRAALLFLVTTTLPGSAVGGQAPTDQVDARLQQEEATREVRDKVAEIFAAMAVRPGAVVADVGAGGGFLTVRLACAVGLDGRVLAVDVNPQVVERLRARVERERLTNVEIVTGDEDDPRLPPGALDAAVIVNAYHEMREYRGMLAGVRRALKPDGRLVIVEPVSDPRRGSSREDQVRAHEIAPAFVQQEAREAGFRIVRLQDPFTERSTDVLWLLVAVPDHEAESR